MRNKILRICFVCLVLCAFMIISNFLGTILMPQRLDYGSTWDSYLVEPKDSVDILFFGSSMVYCNVIPATLYKNTGITSYVMAGPEMTIPITYYYIREACRTQSPKVIAVELNGLFYGRYTNFTKVTVGYMPWSANRIGATFNAAEKEERLGLMFPLYNYHSRLSEVSRADLISHLCPAADPYAGYTPLSKAVPQTEIIYRGYRSDTEEFARNLMYLKKISEFCEVNNIKLLLYVSPATAQIPPEALETMKEQIHSWGEFIDFNPMTQEMQIDNQTDWYDNLHFNVHGANKFTNFLGHYLKELFALPETVAEDVQLWLSRIEQIEAYQKEAMAASES